MFQNNVRDLFELFQTALINAAMIGNVRIAKFLIEQGGVDVNTKFIYLIYLRLISIIWNLFGFCWTALMYASASGNIKLVKLLLKQEGIDIDANDVHLFELTFVSMI